jgi:hypothetical protein
MSRRVGWRGALDAINNSGYSLLRLDDGGAKLFDPRDNGLDLHISPKALAEMDARLKTAYDKIFKNKKGKP